MNFLITLSVNSHLLVSDFFFVITFCGNCAKERKKGKHTTQGGTAARGYFFSPESQGWPPSASRCAPNHFGGAPLPCASVAPSRPSRPPGMSTGKEASVPSDAAATDRLNGSVGAAAKRPRDSEGSHHLRSDGRGTRRSHRERPSTPPAAGAGAERYGGPASNPKAEALSENLGCAHAHGCCESSEAELARRELLELITAPDADVGGAIKLLFSQPRTSSSRRTRAVAGHLEYDSGEDASARVLFHRAAQAGSPLLLAGAPLPPDVGDGA